MYIINCLYCGSKKESARKPSQRRGKYCSAPCASKHYHSTPRTKRVKDPNSKCSWCDKLFYKTESRKASSKSGLIFCCRKHKDLAQRLDGLAEIHPKHYGTSSRAMGHYRTKAFEQLENECNRCGYKEHKQLLDIHHKDEDKNNNHISNLEILCIMCHKKHHFGLK